jgi:hypothetical protein
VLSLAPGHIAVGHIDSNNKSLPCTIHIYSKTDSPIRIIINFNRPASKKDYVLLSEKRRLTIPSSYRMTVFARDSIRYRVEADEPATLIIKAEFSIPRIEPEVGESSPELRRHHRGIDIQEYMNIQLLPPATSAKKLRPAQPAFDKNVETLLAYDRGSKQRMALQRSSIESVRRNMCLKKKTEQLTERKNRLLESIQQSEQRREQVVRLEEERKKVLLGLVIQSVWTRNVLVLSELHRVFVEIKRLKEQKRKQARVDNNYAQTTKMMKCYTKLMGALRSHPSQRIQRE